MPESLAEICARAAVEMGFSRAAGHIFGTVFGAPAALTADDLCKALNLSRSNVSTALKELRLSGLVVVIRIKGDRKEYFSVPDDPWTIVSRLLNARRHRLIDPLVQELARAVDAGDARAGGLLAAVGSIAEAIDAAIRLDPALLGQLVAAGPPDAARKKDKKRKKKG